ncbi:MAG: phosphatase PAP2 family protein [Bacteroidota bacterium]|nr:phosphatase PAP2 family protein [Bacteroidota bacterium]
MAKISATENHLFVYRSKLKSNPPSLFAAKNIRVAAIITVSYFLLSYVLIGFKTDQILLAGFVNLCYFASHPTRRFILGFSIFIVYWIVFDYMKAFPNYRFNTVHIQSLYEWEKSWFGITYNEVLITPNEYFLLHTTTLLDVLAGIFYLCWVPLPLLFAGILFYKNKTLFFQFSLTFFLVNIIGFIGYYIYPAAPPWYVAKNGFDFVASTPGNTAGLARFDSFFGVSIFRGLYAKSSNVFAAMPSLHAAYLVIVLFFGIKSNLRGWNILFAIVMLGIWFAAVYSSHHYILDVLAGILCALSGIVLFRAFCLTSKGHNFIRKLVVMTSA